MDFVIKGAIYFNGEIIVSPIFTTTGYMVDCIEYRTIKDIKKTCSDMFYRTIDKTDYILYKDKFILLSDLSSLSFEENNNEF
jgi:hypothetical protein